MFSTLNKNAENLPRPVEIFNAIISLNSHKACGYDISAVLRVGNEVLALIVTVYFEVAFEHVFFLQIFKTAQAILIYTAGKKMLQIFIDYFPYYLAYERYWKKLAVNFFLKALNIL